MSQKIVSTLISVKIDDKNIKLVLNIYPMKLVHMCMQVIMLHSFNNDLNENVRLKSKMSMWTGNFSELI